jgi:hypothetical protein
MAAGVSFPGEKNGHGVKLTIQLHPVPRGRKHGTKYPFHHKTSWRSAQLPKHEQNFAFTLTSLARKQKFNEI